MSEGPPEVKIPKLPPVKVRIPNLPREEWTDPAREVFAFWGEPNAWEEGSKTNIIMVMAQHPELALAYSVWGKHLLMANTVGTRALELIVLRVSWHVKSEYEWHNHVGYALNAGLTLEEVAATRNKLSEWKWDDKDKLVLEAVDQLVKKSRISDALWKKLSKHYNKKQMMDLTFTIGHYVMTAWALSAFGVGLESPDPIGFDLKTASGKTPHASFKPRETEDWIKTRGY